MNFEENNNFTALSLHPVDSNINSLSWGPNGLLAISSEHIISIYQQKLNEFKLIQIISKRKSNISIMKWNSKIIEIGNINCFTNLLAIGDENGNCLIYKLSSGNHFSGISPFIGSNISILDIQWSLDNENILFILTSTPSLICVTITSQRRSSNVEISPDPTFPFNLFNMKLLWNILLKDNMEFILIDPFRSSNLLLFNKKSQYLKIHLSKKTENPVLTPIKIFVNIKSLLYLEYWPLYPDIVIITTLNNLYFYDLNLNNFSIFLINDNLPFFPIINSFHSQISNKFWSMTLDGNLTRFKLSNNDFWEISNFINTSINQIHYIISDPFYPNRIAIHSKNGKVLIFEEKNNNKIFCIHLIPYFSNYISTWICKDEKIIFSTNNGDIGIFENNNILKFKINDNEINKICLINKKIAIQGKNIYIIDLLNRKIQNIHKNSKPYLLTNSLELFAFRPLPSIVDILNNNGTKRTLSFKSMVILLTGDIQSNNKWCIILDNFIGYIIDNDISLKFNLSENIGLPISLILNLNNLYIITNKNELIIYNLNNLEFKIIKYSISSLLNIFLFETMLILIDNDNICSLIETQNFKIVSQAKWKVINVQFFNSIKVIIQTSKMSIRMVQLPNFEPISINFNNEKNLKYDFFQSLTLKDFKKNIYLLGDLKLLTFLKVIQRKNKLPTSNFYGFNKKQFLLIEKSKSACEYNNINFRNKYIDHLIYLGNLNKASNELLKLSDNISLLLSYICLSPNINAIDSILNSNYNLNNELISKILIITNQKEKALNFMIKNKEYLNSIRFLRTNFEDEEIIKILYNFPEKISLITDNPIFTIILKDFEKSFNLLLSNNEYIKSFLLLCYIKENNFYFNNKELELKIIKKWNEIKNNVC